MKFEPEELDKKIIEKLMSQGIFISQNAPPMNKEKALVLIGETMLDKFVKEFVSLWKNELFPHCLLRDYEASEEEMHRMIHDEPWDKSAAQKKKGPEGDEPSEVSESH